MARKNEGQPPLAPGAEHKTTSLLLDACERLRYDLLSFVASRASYGPPVFGPALLFLEDPREGVLRPATKVTWDDLRLAPLLDNLLAGCLTRLSVLQHCLKVKKESEEGKKGAEADPEVEKAVQQYLRQYEIHNPDKPKLTDAVERTRVAAAAVTEAIASGMSQALDDIFVQNPDSNKFIERLEFLRDDHLKPTLGPLSFLPSEYAIALGVSPEASLPGPDLISDVITTLIGIAKERKTAWDYLQEQLRLLKEKNLLADFEKAVRSSADAIVQTDNADALFRQFTESCQQAGDSIKSLRSAILLFRIAPQEIGSSLAYLTLQYRNARSYLREHLSYEHNLITTTYSKGSYEYENSFVDVWPLYRLTQRLERLFYGGASSPQKNTAVISNITFIPVSYFPGQIIGQVVMSTPIALDVPSLIDFSQYYIREIRGAAISEFISLIQRALKDKHPGQQINHPESVLRAVAESLTAILSVQSLSAFVRTRTTVNIPSTYKLVYDVAREDGTQPHDLINAYITGKLSTDLKIEWDDWQKENKGKSEEKINVREYSLTSFLKDGVQAIGPRRRTLQPPPEPAVIEAPGKFDDFFEEQAEERVFVISSNDDGHRTQRLTDIMPALYKITHTNQGVADSFLLLRLPLGSGELEPESREAIFIVRLWEPARAVENMKLSVLHTVWNGIRSCSALIRVADDAAKITGAMDVAHFLTGPIAAVKAFYETDVLPELPSLKTNTARKIKECHLSLLVLDVLAKGIKERSRRRQPATRRSAAESAGGNIIGSAGCDVLELAVLLIQNPMLKRSLKGKNVKVRLHSDLPFHSFLGPTFNAELATTLDSDNYAPLKVQGSKEDWTTILYTLLKNACEATPESQFVDLCFIAYASVRDLISRVDIVIENPGSLSITMRKQMEECLRNERNAMEPNSSKPDSMGMGLAITGEVLQHLKIKPAVLIGDSTIRILLSGVYLSS